MKRIIRNTLAALIVILVFASCKTAPPLPGIVRPFGMVGDNADMYIYMPIEKNKRIAEPILTSVGGDAMKQALSRTTAVYSGVFVKSGLPEIRICSTGKYPYGVTDSIFKKKNGWEPKKTKEKYKYYTSPYIDVSIPSPQIACLVLGPDDRLSMEAFLGKLAQPEEAVFSQRFDALVNSGSQDIGIFVKNGDFFLDQIIGVQLGLPVGVIEMYLKKNSGAEGEYIYDLSVETKNVMTASLLKLFFKKQLKADVRIEENKLIIENRSVSESKIIAIIKSLYNY
ncbi:MULTISPECIES: hypothetical protein [unclassified Treponema]|uniref:hypothetical protein n=1 Tax=unclassified Treponema TaxID=2638727 RepID=UPI0020A3DF58|nr:MULTISPECIES: hypothetical protein [unclassified Treponema]